MRIVFAGTPDFAATVLAALIASRHRLAAVYTQPDRPAGRGRRARPGPVKRLAAEHGLLLRQPHTLRGPEPAAELAALAPDALVVAAYGLILPAAILDVAPHGGINVHASLLPRWRGAAPIQRAILAGDRETGISIMQMDEGLDTGPVLRTARCRVDDHDTAASLHERLAALGAATLLAALDEVEAGTAIATPQPETGVTHAARIDKREAEIDWTRPAPDLERAVRAFVPAPVAWTTPPGADPRRHRLRLWSARVGPAPGGPSPPGTIVDSGTAGIDVRAGEGTLRLLEVQPAGSRRMSAAEYLNARRLVPGERLGA